jgi:transposase-like protein
MHRYINSHGQFKVTTSALTAAFKISVINMVKERGNQAAGRDYGVDESLVCRWCANWA